MTKPTNITQVRAKQVAERTQDAYSFERYGAKAWYDAALALFQMGLSERGVEAVLRSKWMRWAADAAARGDGAGEAVDIVRYIRREYPQLGGRNRAIQNLIDETF